MEIGKRDTLVYFAGYKIKMKDGRVYWANKYKIEGESVKIEVAFGGGFDLQYRTFVVPLNDVLEIRERQFSNCYNYRDISIKEQDGEVRGQSQSLIDDK